MRAFKQNAFRDNSLKFNFGVYKIETSEAFDSKLNKNGIFQHLRPKFIPLTQ